MCQVPLEDIEKASKRGLVFKVADKQGPGRRWQFVDEFIDSIEVAVARAKDMGGYESAVFLPTQQANGFLYWTSRDPELFNSTVLDLDVLRFGQEMGNKDEGLGGQRE
jgi:hypothetical protein